MRRWAIAVVTFAASFAVTMHMLIVGMRGTDRLAANEPPAESAVATETAPQNDPISVRPLIIALSKESPFAPFAYLREYRLHKRGKLA